MNSDANQFCFNSSVKYNADRIQAAAVYCSDGRFGEQFDDLMHNALGLPRYDRLAVPEALPAWPAIFLCTVRKMASLNSCGSWSRFTSSSGSC